MAKINGTAKTISAVDITKAVLHKEGDSISFDAKKYYGKNYLMTSAVQFGCMKKSNIFHN
jgi:hypothetical protein